MNSIILIDDQNSEKPSTKAGPSFCTAAQQYLKDQKKKYGSSSVNEPSNKKYSLTQTEYFQTKWNVGNEKAV